MDIEKKLAEYRAKKAREHQIEGAKSSINSLFSSYFKRKEKPKSEITAEADVVPLLSSDEAADNFHETASLTSEDETLSCCSYTDMFYYLMCFALWTILYMIFIEYQFGTVFFLVSALVFMYFNTRTGPKKADEISAYSVFNENCKSIDGTLKAEQFEREIRYGPSSVR